MDPDADLDVGQALAPVRSMLFRTVSVVFFGVVTGAIASVAATGFVAAVELLNDLLLISPASRGAVADTGVLIAATLLVPTAGGLVVGLFNRYLIPGGRGHGPPQVIRSAQSDGGSIGVRGGLASAAAAILSLGSGASAGQYGPLVHFGSTVGSVIGRWSRGSAQMGTVGIGCGVAAAIATAFSAPIAGVLFAHEVVLRHYSLRAFAPITVASVVGYFLATRVFRQTPLIRIDETAAVGALDLATFVLIGIAGALVAVVFMQAVLHALRLSRRLVLPDVCKPALAGAVLGIMAIGAPEILGMGIETLRTAVVPTGFGAQELALLLVLKIAATALCLGFGFAGGIFGPAIVIGALFGALVGHGLAVVLPGSLGAVTIYAVCGMAAVTSSVIGAPISTILVVFELTHNYELTTAVMVSVVFSNLVGYRLFGRSMFDVELRQAGFDLRYGRDQVVLDGTSIGPWVSDDYIRLEPGTSCEAARAVIVAAGAEEAQVIDADDRYIGVVDLSRLDAMVDAGDGGRGFDELVHRPAVVLDTRTSIWQAFTRASSFNGHAIPVIAPGCSGRLAGVIPEPVLLQAYLDTMRSIRDEEHAAP